MASGRINLSVTGDYGNVTGWIEWSESSINTANNTSVVTAILYYANAWSTDTYSGTASPPFYLTINGNRAEKSGGATIPAYSTGEEVFRHSVTVTHLADGSKSITISGGGGLSGTHDLRNSSGSGTAVLTTIPRATQPSAPSSAEIGTQITISMPRASSSFTHNLWYKLGDGSYEAIDTGVGTSYAWTIPMSLCSQITGALSGTLTIACNTYNGSTLIGTKTASMTATVPASVKPTVSAMTVDIVNDNTTLAQWGVAVTGYSKLRYAITGSTADDYDATITAYQFQANGETLSAQTGATKVLATAGSMEAKGRVKDSRGRWSDPISRSVQVYDYSVPTIKASHAYRCVQDGTATDDGSYLNVLCDGEISDIGGHNVMTCRVRYRVVGGTWGDYRTLTDNTAEIINAAMAVDRSYEVEIVVLDSLGNSRVVVYQIPTAEVTFNAKRGGKGFAFGKYAEEDNLLESAWPFRVRGSVSCTTMSANALTVDGSAVVDFVVEQGLSTVQGSQPCNWYYQKFASGHFVAWMSGVLSSSASNTAKSATFALPFTLPNTIYSVQLTGTVNSNLVTNVGVRNSAGSGSGKTTELFTVYAILSAASSVSVGVDIEVRGYWK